MFRYLWVYLYMNCNELYMRTFSLITRSYDFSDGEGIFEPTSESCYIKVAVDPDTYDGDEADGDKDDVQAE